MGTPSASGVRSDLVGVDVPYLAAASGTPGADLPEALRAPSRSADVRHANPVPGDDPRDPATVRLEGGSWLLFYVDSAGNLYQQYNYGSALDPYWQSGNVIVTGPVIGPDVARLDSEGGSALGLFYLRTVNSVTQVMERVSTTDGASWGSEVQLTTLTTSAFHLRSITVGATAYLFWSDTTGSIKYETSSDLTSWSSPSALNVSTAPLWNYGYPYFDVAHLANGNWIVAYQAKPTDCHGVYLPYCDRYQFLTLSTSVGPSLSSLAGKIDHLDLVSQRWPGSVSLIQAPGGGSVYLIYDHYTWLYSNYAFDQIGSADGLTWGSMYNENLVGYDPGIDPTGSGKVGVKASNSYPYIDENGHVQLLWQMFAGIGGIAALGVTDPYPDQIFQADLTTGTLYQPVPPYLDPAVNYGTGSIGSGLVNVSSGNLVINASDYSLSGLGLPTTLSRTYNGGDNRDGLFGFGWSFPYAMGLQPDFGGAVTVENYDGRRDYYLTSGSGYTSPPGLDTTLSGNITSGWTLTYKDHTSKSFDPNGKLVSETDADGHTTTLGYTSERLTTITDAAGRIFTLSYDGNGRVISIAIPLSRSLHYAYDALGNLTSFTDASGAVTAYTYSAGHMLTSITDPSGRQTAFTWAGLRRIKTVNDPAGAVTTYTYGSQNSSGGSTTVVDPRGTTTTHAYDSLGRQTSITVAMPGGGSNNLVTSFAYNSDSQLVSQTDPRGIITTYAYDSSGNMTQQVADAGSGKLNLATSSVYTDGDLTSQTDPRGTVTDLAYDSAHHLLSKTTHLSGGVNLVSSYTYNSAGQLTSATSPGGQAGNHSSSYTYDAYGNLATATDADGNITTTVYDAGGRLLSSTDARGKTTSYTYDANDRLLATTDPLNYTTTAAYSPAGEKTSTTDANGVITTTAYDRSGEAVAVTPAASSAGFLLNNPGFELGVFGWTASGSPSIVTTPVLTGSKAAKVDLSDTYSRELPVVAGTNYSLTAYAMATATGQTARLTYAWRNAAHATISSGNIDVATSTAGFLPVTLPPTAAPTGAAYLYLTLGSTAAGAWTIFDDVAPAGSTLTDFDGTGRKTSTTDANGHITRLTYDAASRLVSSTDARGKTTTLTLDKDGNITNSSDPLGINTSAVFDRANRQTTSTLDPGGLALAKSVVYDADGNVISSTDAANHTTVYAYDLANRLTGVTDPASGVTAYAYDLNGNRLTVTDARGKVTSSAYDQDNRLVSSTDALDATTSYTYDASGNRSTRTDANGTITSYTYDDDGRLSGMSYSSGGSVSYAYDPLGQMTSMTDAHGTTTWTYSPLRQILSVSQPGSASVNYTYDPVGNRTSVSLAGKTTSYTYNEGNALTNITDWASRTTSYSYDNAGRLTGVTYPNGISATYTLDHAGRATNLAYVKSGTTVASFAYTFNASSQRLTETTAAGITNYSYDNLGRLTGATYPGSGSESFGYDAVGNRTSAGSSGTTTTYAYNDVNEIANSSSNGSLSTYAYDANGNRTSVTTLPLPDTAAPTTPTGLSATAISDSEIDLAWSASSDNYGVTGYRIYRGGTLIATVSGTATSFADVSAQPSTAYAYTISALDAAGNASSQSSSAGDTTAAGTIGPDATAPSVPTNLAGTAVAGGRIDLSWNASSDDVAVSGYNIYRDGNKINTVPVGSTSYSDTGLAPGVGHTWTVSAIDAAGNQSAVSSSWSGAAGSGASVVSYTYDPENRLTQATSGSQTLGSYAYDAIGDRTSKTAGALTTAYTNDLATALPQVLCETAGSSSTYYAYPFAGGAGPLEIEINGTPYWYLTDALGSVRLVTDASGNTPSTYSYSAFGNTRIHTGTLSNEILFAGQRTDQETGLQYLRARTYDPTSGTFLQRDTYGGQDQLSQSQNRYLYAQGDSANRVDPSGYCDPTPWGLLGCAGDGIGGIGNFAQDSGKTSSDIQAWVGQRASEAVDTPNKVWQASGGRAVNYAADHPFEAASIVIAGGVCAAAFEACAVGALSYALPKIVSNAPKAWQTQDPTQLVDGMALKDLIMAGAGGAILSPLEGAGVEGFLMNSYVGAGLDVWSQKVANGNVDNHWEPACQGLAAGLAAQVGKGALRAGAWGLLVAVISFGPCSASPNR